jgi:glycosyltransferase involved in cell wall biosynthesis
MITPLLVHDFYKQPGGEDQVFALEHDMLQARGHRVVRYTVHNRFVDLLGKLSLFRKTLWNRLTYRELLRTIREEKPDVVHFHNTFPLISPAAYWAAKRAGVAVVQTLHNYRLLCPEARFFRGESTCELCLHRHFAWPAVRYACYQNNHASSMAVAAMLALHHAIGTWKKKVDRYIVLTDFARWKFCEGGIAPDKIAVKPNCLVEDPGAGRGDGGYVLFVGRLSPEKGLDTLLEAWSLLKKRPRLKIVGEGPLVHQVVERIQRLDGVEYLGTKTHDEVFALMKAAQMLVVPSLWYEGFPMTVVEAFASGLPVVASRLGGLSELVRHGETGLHFRPGDVADLAQKLDEIHEHPETLAPMRSNSRREFENKYTAQRNYEILIDIYERAMAEAGKR